MVESPELHTLYITLVSREGLFVGFVNFKLTVPTAGNGMLPMGTQFANALIEYGLYKVARGGTFVFESMWTFKPTPSGYETWQGNSTHPMKYPDLLRTTCNIIVAEAITAVCDVRANVAVVFLNISDKIDRLCLEPEFLCGMKAYADNLLQIHSLATSASSVSATV